VFVSSEEMRLCGISQTSSTSFFHSCRSGTFDESFATY
jgi:hypothetical protein